MCSRSWRKYASEFLCTYVDAEGTMRGTNLHGFARCGARRSCRSLRRAAFAVTREVRALERMGMNAAVGMAMYLNKLR